MLKKLVVLALVVFLALVFDISLCARGLVWDFLGDTHIDGAQDHDRIKIGLRHGPFRAVQLRVSDPIFIRRVVVYYSNGTSEELVIGDSRFSRSRNPHYRPHRGRPRPRERRALVFQRTMATPSASHLVRHPLIETYIRFQFKGTINSQYKVLRRPVESTRLTGNLAPST
jgi:hypothetical protein